MTSMNCPECVRECKTSGDLCSPKDPDHASYYEQWMYDAEQEHRRSAHLMPLEGGFYRCPKRTHQPIEAHPADAMRAAGMQPML